MNSKYIDNKLKEFREKFGKAYLGGVERERFEHQEQFIKEALEQVRNETIEEAISKVRGIEVGTDSDGFTSFKETYTKNRCRDAIGELKSEQDVTVNAISPNKSDEYVRKECHCSQYPYNNVAFDCKNFAFHCTHCQKPEKNM